MSNVRWLFVSVCVVLFTLTASAQTSEKYVILDFNTALSHVFDAGTNTELNSFHVGASPSSMVISPNGRIGFVANLNSNYLSVIDFSIGAEIYRVHNVRLGSLTLSRDGNILVGADVDDDGLTVIDANSFNVIQNISLDGKLGDDPTINGDNEVSNVVVVNVGGHYKVYVETFHDFGVADLSTGLVTDLGAAPASTFSVFGTNTVAATADEKFVLINRQGAVLTFDPTSNTSSPFQTFSLGNVISVATSRSTADPAKIYGYLLRAAASRSVAVLDLTAGSPTFGAVLGEVSLPASFPFDTISHLAPNADGTRVSVSTNTTASPNLYTIDTSIPAAPAIVGSESFAGPVRYLTSAVTSNLPSTSAPVVSSVNVPLVTNDADAPIQISGTGFAANAQVRIGNLDPISAQVISSSQLQVTVPAHSAAQGAPIIVTNPNSGQGILATNQSGILRNAFIVASQPTFKPVNQVGITNLGDSAISILNVSTNTTISPEVSANPRTLSMAMTPDGLRAYVVSLAPPATVQVFNFATNSFEASIPLSSSATGNPGQTKSIVVARRFGTSQMAAYVASSRRVGPGPNGFVLDLHIIDADPASPTFNTVVASVPTTAPNPGATSGGLVVTPDGHYAIVNAFVFDTALGQVNLSVDNLVVVDLSNTAAPPTIISTATLGVTGWQFAPEISPDGNYLLLICDDGTISVFDITTPTSPVPAGKIAGSLPGNPAASDFSQLGNTFVLGGTPTIFAAIHDVTPDGSLMYIPLREEDSVAVVDTVKVINNLPNALVTKIGAGIAPEVAAVRPGTATPAGSNVSVAPIQPVSLTFGTVVTAGATSVTTTNTNPDPLPAGFSLGTPPVYYEISTTATFAGTIQVCISYNPAQFTSAESAIRMLHDESGTFVDITSSLDTVNHRVCGNASHFSAFTIGVASIPFLYNSLIREIQTGVTNTQFQQQLLQKVQSSQQNFNKNSLVDAIDDLQDFTHKVQEQTGKLITGSEANRLIGLANALIAQL